MGRGSTLSSALLRSLRMGRRSWEPAPASAVATPPAASRAAGVVAAAADEDPLRFRIESPHSATLSSRLALRFRMEIRSGVGVGVAFGSSSVAPLPLMDCDGSWLLRFQYRNYIMHKWEKTYRVEKFEKNYVKRVHYWISITNENLLKVKFSVTCNWSKGQYLIRSQ